MSVAIDFGFRFDRNASKHNEAIEVRHGLALRFADSVNSNKPVERVELYPVSRAGNSGSEVFYCDIYFEERALPRRQIAKFQDCKSTEREYKAALEARDAQMCTEPTKILDDNADLGMIVYDLARAKEHREFRGIFLDLEVKTEFCCEALRSALRDVAQHPNGHATRIPIYEDYKRYLDRRSNPKGKMEALVAAASDWQSLANPAREILKVLSQIESQVDHLVLPHLVHGDLHARNLVIDERNPSRTELIDFDWVHYGHPVKDLALMEATLKYMLLSELIQIRLGKQACLSFEAYCGFESFLIEHGLDLPEPGQVDFALKMHVDANSDLAQLLWRTYACIVEIRRTAKSVLDEYCRSSGNTDALREYYVGLFLITFGIFGIQETERFWALAGLHCLAKQLEA